MPYSKPFPLKDVREGPFLQMDPTPIGLLAIQRLGLFVWDSQGAIWEERLNELRTFKEIHGQCDVPATFSENRLLAI
jgi:hypothetical protein